MRQNLVVVGASTRLHSRNLRLPYTKRYVKNYGIGESTYTNETKWKVKMRCYEIFQNFIKKWSAIKRVTLPSATSCGTVFLKRPCRSLLPQKCLKSCRHLLIPISIGQNYFGWLVISDLLFYFCVEGFGTVSKMTKIFDFRQCNVRQRMQRGNLRMQLLSAWNVTL